MYDKGYMKLRLGIAFALLLIFGVYATAIATEDNRKIAKGMQDFNQMTAADFVAGEFVQGTVYELDDEFAYLESYNSTFGIKHNERVTAHYYVMPLPSTYYDQNVKYVAVCLKNSAHVAIAEKMMQETWDYWDYGTEPAVWTELPMTGKVQKMDGEVLDYFYEWMMFGEESTNRADFDKYICPYVINYYEVGNTGTGMIVGIVMIVVGAVGLAVMIALHLKNKNAPAAAYPSYPEGTGYNSVGGYNPVNGRAVNQQARGEASMEEAAELMKRMESIKQPEDNADDFFGGMGRSAAAKSEEPKKEEPQPSAQPDFMDMDSIDTSSLGIGIGDDD